MNLHNADEVIDEDLLVDPDGSLGLHLSSPFVGIDEHNSSVPEDLVDLGDDVGSFISNWVAEDLIESAVGNSRFYNVILLVCVPLMNIVIID